jgi:uncharacterized membrane protein YgcG
MYKIIFALKLWFSFLGLVFLGAFSLSILENQTRSLNDVLSFAAIVLILCFAGSILTVPVFYMGMTWVERHQNWTNHDRFVGLFGINVANILAHYAGLILVLFVIKDGFTDFAFLIFMLYFAAMLIGFVLIFLFSKNLVWNNAATNSPSNTAAQATTILDTHIEPMYSNPAQQQDILFYNPLIMNNLNANTVVLNDENQANSSNENAYIVENDNTNEGNNETTNGSDSNTDDRSFEQNNVESNDSSSFDSSSFENTSSFDSGSSSDSSSSSYDSSSSSDSGSSSSFDSGSSDF